MHGVVVRRRIHFWEKGRWDDWQKEFMWTVQRMTEDAVPSPDYSLPHPPSHLKNQIPLSLFPLLSHPLSQTWIMNASALRCFDSPTFKSWSPHFHLSLLSSCRLYLSAAVSPLALPSGRAKVHPKRQCSLPDETQVAFISLLFFSWEAGKKLFIFHALSLSPSLVKLCLLFIPGFFQQRLTFFSWPCEAVLLWRKLQHWAGFSLLFQGLGRSICRTCSWILTSATYKEVDEGCF